jgi:hypothetical protein
LFGIRAIFSGLEKDKDAIGENILEIDAKNLQVVVSLEIYEGHLYLVDHAADQRVAGVEGAH